MKQTAGHTPRESAATPQTGCKEQKPGRKPRDCFLFAPPGVIPEHDTKKRLQLHFAHLSWNEQNVTVDAFRFYLAGEASHPHK